MKKSSIMFTLVILILTTISCSQNTETNKIEDNIVDYHFKLNKVDYSQLYFNRYEIYNVHDDGNLDENGVALFLYNNQLYYHPVYIGQRCQMILSDYYNTGNEMYLNIAIKSAEALLKKAVRINNSIYFPYEYDFIAPVHYVAPWYSGMAQGVVLSLLSRLYYFTNDEYYHSKADSVFNSLKIQNNQIPVSFVIKNSDYFKNDKVYFWIDEYPYEPERYVLNGSLAGAFGLYDYWWATGNEQAKDLFSKEMSTIKDNILFYRSPKSVSYYDLYFKEKKADYHGLHIYQLMQCFLYTNDSYFASVSNLFYQDYHEIKR